MRNNFYISFGIWVAILPFIGVPSIWKTILIVVSGIFVSVLNLTPLILKKLQQPKQRSRKKQISTEAGPPIVSKFVDKAPKEIHEIKELRFAVDSRESVTNESH